MPKPFFLFALAPGGIAAEIIGSRYRWISASVFLMMNVVAYAVGVYALCVLRQAIKATTPAPARKDF